MFKVRIINRHSDRWNQTGIVEEKMWESESLLISVMIGNRWCMFYRRNLQPC